MLRALPNLQKLDNVEVTPEEVQDALKGGGQVQREEEVYEDAYTNGPAQEQQNYQQQPPPQQTQQQQHPPVQQQQQWRGQSPVREVCVLRPIKLRSEITVLLIKTFSHSFSFVYINRS